MTYNNEKIYNIDYKIRKYVKKILKINQSANIFLLPFKKSISIAYNNQWLPFMIHVLSLKMYSKSIVEGVSSVVQLKENQKSDIKRRDFGRYIRHIF